MNEFTVRRIVVACDAVSENRAGIEAAARLARSWNALLHAVFVQDEDLLHLAAFPFVRQTGAGGPQMLDEAAMLRQFEADAARARATLEAAARSYALTPSFAVVRGRPALAALSVADRDLLVILATARPFAGQFKLASRWLAAALEAPLPVLLLRNHMEWVDGIVCAIRSAAPSSWRALQAAATIAIAANRRLVVRIVDEAVSAGELRERLRDVAPDLAEDVRIEGVRSGVRLDAGENSLLVLDAAFASSDRAALRRLIESAPADILFVR